MRPASITLLLLLVATTLVPRILADDSPFAKTALKDGDQILFLGDSITQAGVYVAFIQLYLWDKHPDLKFEIVNVGLGGETASGNNEPTHPYPRPVIHERLPRILKATDPNLVLICYGMNDGIYHPFDSSRFDDYRNGMNQLIQIYEKMAEPVPIVLMTPTLFDLPSARQRAPMVPDSADDYPFAYNNTFFAYDQVLQRYADWVKSQQQRAVATVDLHSALYRFVRANRAMDKGYRFGDGVHPPTEGHLEMALTILQSLGIEEARDQAYARLLKLTNAALVNDPGPPAKPTPLWQKMLQRERLLSAAWRESIGHTKPNKSKALPLEEAKVQAAKLEQEIRAMLAAPR
jgi:lysophospholipase L1-like esterase